MQGLLKKILLWIYLSSPLFLLLDLGTGIDMRVSFLDAYSGWKVVYYIFCFAIGLVMYKVPSLEAILGLVEGGVNVLALSLSILLPYYQAIEQASNGVGTGHIYDQYTFFNYAISGGIIFFSLQIRAVKTRD